MIEHNYVNATDDIAQYQADMLQRQEVSYDYYMNNLTDKNVWVWVGDELYYMGMEPWRLNMDVEVAQERGFRLFVQKNELENV